MTASRIKPALIVWLLAILVIALSGWILLPFPRPPTGWEEVAWSIGFGVGFATVGALLVDRRPNEPVSRITLGIGLIVVAAVGLRALAVALDARPGALPPLGALAAVASQALQTAAFLAAGSFLLIRFPSGRQPGRLPNTVDALVALILVFVTVGAFAPGRIRQSWLSPSENPIGIAALDSSLFTTIANLGFLGYFVSLALSILVLAQRYRRSDSVARAQIRWVAAVGLVQIAILPLLWVGDWMWSVWLLSTALLPIAIGIAILRYHLFEIDRLVGRTLAYAIVTALLAAVFLGTNLVLQAAAAGAIGESPVAVAVSTLLVAALFQPIRRRVQAPIDQRFNRAHLDAERVVGTFAHRTRDEVDLGQLRDAVLQAASDSMRPSGAGLWLRRAMPGDTRAAGEHLGVTR